MAIGKRRAPKCIDPHQHIRPRGAAGLAALGFVLVLAIVPLVKNTEYSGSPGGTAMLAPSGI